MSSRPTHTYRTTLVVTAIALLGGLLLAPSTAQGQAIIPATDAQVFYVPIPEAQVAAMMSILDNSYTTGDFTNITTVVSIAVWGNGTIVYYDHAEDGYEEILSQPTQPTSQVWGDGDASNGVWPGAAGSADADDVLSAGDVISLRNNININTPGVYWSGGDKIGASRPVAVTRVAWESGYGPVIAGAVEVYETREYGTEFVAPVGEDIAASAQDRMFLETWMTVMAAHDDTEIFVGGASQGTIDEGESLLLSNVHVGTTVTSDKPVQVHLQTGDPYNGGLFELRWYTLAATAFWGSDYYTPVGTSDTTGHPDLPNVVEYEDPVAIFAYNPNAFPIAVKIDTDRSTQGADSCIEVAAGATARQDMPMATYSGSPPMGWGGRIFASEQSCAEALSEIDDASAPYTFYGIAAVNASEQGESSTSEDNDVWDWGFALVPFDRLTTQALVGWGPGNSNVDPTTARNGSPVWAIAIGNTTLYVDYDGNPATTDDIVSYSLAPYQSIKLYDTDNDQTGMRLYTTNDTPIAVAWGEDPEIAGRASPYLDVGTTIYPVPNYTIRKDVALAPGGDLDMSGGVSPGDILRYTIFIINEKHGTLADVHLFDELSEYLLYQPGTTTGIKRTLTGDTPVSIPDDVSGTPFPLDVGGFNLGSLTVFEDEFIVSFDAKILPGLPLEIELIGNEACAEPENSEFKCDDIDIRVPQPRIEILKTVFRVDDPDAGAPSSCPGVDFKAGPTGTAIVYCFEITNTGNTHLLPVVLEDEKLGLDEDLLIAPDAPLAPGESLLWEVPDTIDGRVLNTAFATGYVVTEEGDPIPGTEFVSDNDDAEVQDLGPADPSPELDLQKTVYAGHTSGAGCPGVDTLSNLLPNSDVTYCFTVTNTGNTFLTLNALNDGDLGIALGDLTLLSGSLSEPLEPGLGGIGGQLVYYYQTTATADLENTATATANPVDSAGFDLPNVNDVSDSDIAEVSLVDPEITIEKTTNTFDADTPTGPSVLVGGNVDWVYVVTNTGNIRLTDVTVTDVQVLPAAGSGPTPNCETFDGSLDPGESITCTASGVAIAGQYGNLATATGTWQVPDGSPQQVSDTDPSHYFGVNPSILLEKSGEWNDDGLVPDVAEVGETISYVFRVTNTGNVALSNITIIDPIVSVSGELLLLPPGGVDATTFTGTYVVKQQDIDEGFKYNIAEVFGTPSFGSIVSDTDDENVPLPQNPVIDLDKTIIWTADIDESGTINEGDEVTYVYTVFNPVDENFDPTDVDDPGSRFHAPEDLQSKNCDPSLLTSLNEAAICEATYVVTTAALGGDMPQSMVDVDVFGELDAGDTITYLFDIVNTGNVTLDPVSLSDPLVGLTDTTCGADTLAPTESTQCSATFLLTQAEIDDGLLDNTAVAKGTAPDQTVVQDEDSELLVFPAQPALTLEKTASPTTYSAVDDVIAYTYVLTNSGNVTLSEPFSIVDDKSTDESCPATPASLAPGESITCEATYTITQADLDAGSVTNTAQGFGKFGEQEVASNEDQETATAQQNPAIDVVKTADPMTYDEVGDVISYGYTITNIGNVTLSGVTLVDDKASVSCTPSIPTSLEPLGVITCTASYTITLADLNAGSVTNVATATGAPPSGPDVSDTDTKTVTAEQNPAIDLEKWTNGEDYDDAPGPNIDEGQPVLWEYFVTNTGNVTLVDVQVTDDQEGPISCPKVILEPGDAIRCTAEGTAAVGQYSNLGTVTAMSSVNQVTDSDPSHYNGQAIITGTRIEITKTVNGGDIPEGTSFTFQVRDPDGVFIDNPAYAVEITSTTLQPAELGPVSPGAYSLCEVGASPMWNTTLIGMPGAFFPDGDPDTVCIPLVVDEGVELIEFSIDNDNDRNETLTIGYWMNHCEPKRANLRKDKLYIDQLLFDTGATLDLGDGFVISYEGEEGDDLSADHIVVRGFDGEGIASGCQPLIRILSKRDIQNGRLRASDPAFNMAAQLLAAELNYLNGALACVGVTDAINDGREVLSQVGFDGGFGDDGYFGELEDLGLTALARDLATVLDNFNNGKTEPCAYEAYDDFTGLLFEKTTNGWDADIAWPMFVPQVEAGSAVEWSYTITNKLGETLTDIVVTDSDDALEIDCGEVDVLEEGQSMTCTASGEAADGLYRNLGTVTGTLGDDGVSSNDPSHYFGTTQ